MASVSKSLFAPGVGSPDPSLGLIINGTIFNDTLFGTANADEIHGGNGADVLFGYAGDDFLFGDAGKDTLIGGAGADHLDGGEGFDTASYASSAGSVYVNLAANTAAYGDAQGDTFNSIEKVIGSNYADVLVANDVGVVFDGGAGHDYLTGGAGVDNLIGGTGNDTLKGGDSLDVLTGGSGADHFVFTWNDGPDVITDFQSGVDKIVLDGFTIHNHGAFGFDGELWTGTEVPRHQNQPISPGGDGLDKVFFDTDDHILYQFNRAGGEPTILATFTSDIQLQTSDFILV